MGAWVLRDSVLEELRYLSDCLLSVASPVMLDSLEIAAS